MAGRWRWSSSCRHVLDLFGTVAPVRALLARSPPPCSPPLLVATLFVPSAVLCSIWLGKHLLVVDAATVALAAAAATSRMFVSPASAPRQPLPTCPTTEAESWSSPNARLAEQSRMARGSDDVSTTACPASRLPREAVKVAPDLPPARCRESGAFAYHSPPALEELPHDRHAATDPDRSAFDSTSPSFADVPRFIRKPPSSTNIDFEDPGHPCRSAPPPFVNASRSSRTLANVAARSPHPRPGSPNEPRSTACTSTFRTHPHSTPPPYRLCRTSTSLLRLQAGDPGRWHPGPQATLPVVSSSRPTCHRKRPDPPRDNDTLVRAGLRMILSS